MLPLRTIISDETMLRYSLLAPRSARQRIAANIAAIEALRDFWLGSSDLVTAVVIGSTDTAEAAPISTTTAETAGQ